MEDFIGLKLLWPTDSKNLPKRGHDIVLVHGFRSGPISDWQNDHQLFWPIELLATDVENVRIFSHGYDKGRSQVKSGGHYELGGVFNHGEDLCSDLRDKWKGERHITFIGHGTGGIVIKSALCYSHARGGEFGSILAKTKHVIFLDTPHLGFNEKTWSRISGEILSEKSRCQWSLWSDVLSNLQKTFAEISGQFNITSACASLTQGVNEFNDDVSPGSSGLTYLPNERSLFLEGVDHWGISKFSGDSMNYGRLLDRILSGMTCKTTDEQHIQSLRRWIGGGLESHTQSETLNADDHRRNLNQYHTNTCNWLFDDQRFKTWADEPGSNPLLWLTAAGGTGKSVICSRVIDIISNRNQPPATPYLMISFHKEMSKCKMATLLASQLLDYVLREQNGIDTEALSFPKENSAICDNVFAFIRLLVSQCQSVYFFVDGVDEVFLAEAEDSLARREELKRLNDDVLTTLRFLFELTHISDGPKVRLWCSSQKRAHIVRWMEQLNAIELAIDEKLIMADVAIYLSTVKNELLDRISDLQNKFEVATLLDLRANSNFRWAYMMRETLQDSRLTTEDLLRRIRKGLPRDLRELYMGRLGELMKLDERDREDGMWPLAKHILSLVAYARRPLRVSELQEALAITRNRIKTDRQYPYCNNLAAECMISQEGILHYCTPLVDFMPMHQGSTDGYMILSHGSVAEFLRPKATRSELEQNNKDMARSTGHNEASYVDETIIAEACLKYLSQDYFSKPFKKRSHVDFEIDVVRRRSHVQDHHFLRYAAKYWYRHFETVGSDHHREITRFIKSPQFLTAIQIQSLYLSGHFLNNFDHLETSYRLMKQNLPEWLKDCDGGDKILADYQSFVAEWCNFLQLGVTDFQMHGEIDKCFWGALGTGNFLHRLGTNIEYNASFLLRDTDTANGELGQRQDQASCYYETVSHDGTRLAVWKATFKRYDIILPEYIHMDILWLIIDSVQRVEVKDVLQLTRYNWYLDRSRAPIQYGPPEVVNLSPKLISWDLFDPCRFRETNIIPSRDISARVSAIDDVQSGSGIRIGSGLFLRQNGGSWVAAISNPGIDSSSYWEDILVHGEYVIRSHRKLIDDKGNCHSNEFGDQAGFKTSRIGFGIDTDEEVSEDDYDNWYQKPDTHPKTKDRDSISSAEELCIYHSDYESSDGSLSEPFMLRPLRTGATKKASSDSESSDLSSSQNNIDSDSISDSDRVYWPVSSSSSSSPTSSITLQTSSDADDEEFDVFMDAGDELIRNQPGISRVKPPHYLCICDRCDKIIIAGWKRRVGVTKVIFYQCHLCGKAWKQNQYDICRPCFEKGAWCQNHEHQLHKSRFRYSTYRVTWLDTVSWNDARSLISIHIERNNHNTSKTSTPIFRYNTRQPGMLHNSRPVMHQVLPLVIYPLDGYRFLFGHVLKNTYFIHIVPFEKREKPQKGRNQCVSVSVQMRFSPCGRYLHAARITAHKAAIGSSTRMFIHVFTIALSTQDPCSGQPFTLSRGNGIELGVWRSPRVSQLPFTLTWRDEDLYVSISRDVLTVFKFSLRVVDGRKDPSKYCTSNLEDQHVYTFSKQIALPRSSRCRSVSFLPETTKSAAKIILGSLCGERPEPPIVVYLKADGTDIWVKADDAVPTYPEPPMTRNDPLLEDFDEDDDCDLIIPIMDFQR